MTQDKRICGNGMTLAQARAAHWRWLAAWHMRSLDGMTYRAIAEALNVSVERARQLSLKGQQFERLLLKRPRPWWVADVWGDK